MLCSNRPEGFGPQSRIHASLPTTCFLDVIAIPLATWIFLLLIPIPLIACFRNRPKTGKSIDVEDSSNMEKETEVAESANQEESTNVERSSSIGKSTKEEESAKVEERPDLGESHNTAEESTHPQVVTNGVSAADEKSITTEKHDHADAEKTTGKPRKPLLARILAAIYYLLAVAMLAMQSLEIARLVVAHLGLGLLPFTYVGILLAVVFHYFTTSLVARGVNVLFWLMLIAAMSIKVATLIKEEGKFNRRGVTNNYPLGDEVTDVATMVGVEFVLALLELLAR